MTYRINIKKIFFAVFFLFLITAAYSQNVKLPMLQAQNQVDSLCWNEDASLFAYSDGNSIIIRNSQDFTVYQTLETQAEKITNIMFIENDIFSDQEDNFTYILYTTALNDIQIEKLYFQIDETGAELPSNETILQLSGEPSIISTAFCCNADLSFIAFGYENGNLEYFIPKEENQNSEVQNPENEDIENQSLAEESNDIPVFTDCGNGYKKATLNISETAIENLTYNFTNKELISVDSQKSIILWNKTLEKQEAYPSDFYSDSIENIWIFINSEETPYKKYYLSSDFQKLFILLQDNSIAAYDIQTHQTIGYIPSFTESPVTNFSVDNSNNYFLISHEDNSIFVFQAEKIILSVYSQYMQPQIFNMDEPGALENLLSDELPKNDALTMLRYKDVNTINLRLKTEVIPSPYIIGINFAAGYTDYKLLQPFYFAGYIEPYIGFPQKDFPYQYEMHGEPLSSPKIFGMKIYAPFGICVYPFQKNIEFFVDVSPGIVLNNIWNSKLGKNRITSRCYPAFCAALHAGATYQNVSVFVEGNYDAILGFGFSIGVGYNFNFNSLFFVKDDKNEE